MGRGMRIAFFVFKISYIALGVVLSFLVEPVLLWGLIPMYVIGMVFGAALEAILDDLMWFEHHVRLQQKY